MVSHPKQPAMTLREVADALSVSKDVARDLIRRRELPAFKAGKEWRVNVEALERFRSGNRAA